MLWQLAIWTVLAADPGSVQPAAAAAPVKEIPVNTVVVCPREFTAALDPLLAHRYKQGHRMVYLPSSIGREEIRNGIRKAAAQGTLKHILIVGDARAPGPGGSVALAKTVPTFLAPAKVNVQFGSEPEIASDNFYADLDDDGIPDVAIGRMTADSPAELTVMVKKILAYESQIDQGMWRRNIHFVAGVGNFGGLIDPMIESSTKNLLCSGIPTGFNTSMTYASWRSPYCPDPRAFQSSVIEKHNAGCLFWVYLGHGARNELDQMAVPGARFPILRTADCSKLRSQNGLSIAVLLACYTGAFDQPEDCLAEEMLRAPQGPVAVIGGSRVTMPYGMAVLGTEFLQTYFDEKPATLGEAILAAKQKAMKPLDPMAGENPKNVSRQLIEGVAAALSPTSNLLDEERREHLLLMNLLGDPMLRMNHPQDLAVQAPAKALSGKPMEVRVDEVPAGRVVLEFACRRDCFKEKIEARDHFDPSDEGLAEFTPVYERANDTVWERKVIDHAGGPLVATLFVPESAQGFCCVRAFSEHEKSHGVGAAPVWVSRPKKTTR